MSLELCTLQSSEANGKFQLPSKVIALETMLLRILEIICTLRLLLLPSSQNKHGREPVLKGNKKKSVSSRSLIVLHGQRSLELAF